jgi:hypothetical protein
MDPSADMDVMIQAIQSCAESIAKRPRKGPHPSETLNQTDDAMQDTIDMTASSTGGVIPPVDEEETTRNALAMSCSAWIEEGRPVNCDTNGMSYRLLGPGSYKEYMKKVQDEANNIVDVGLPSMHDDADIHYVDPDCPKDDATWTGLQATRTRGSKLMVYDMGYRG